MSASLIRHNRNVAAEQEKLKRTLREKENEQAHSFLQKMNQALDEQIALEKSSNPTGDFRGINTRQVQATNGSNSVRWQHEADDVTLAHNYPTLNRSVVGSGINKADFLHLADASTAAKKKSAVWQDENGPRRKALLQALVAGARSSNSPVIQFVDELVPIVFEQQQYGNKTMPMAEFCSICELRCCTFLHDNERRLLLQKYGNTQVGAACYCISRRPRRIEKCAFILILI